MSAVLDDLKKAVSDAIADGEARLKAAKEKAKVDVAAAKSVIDADVAIAKKDLENELKKIYVGSTVVIKGIKGAVDKIVKDVVGEMLILEDDVRRHFTKAEKK